MILDVCSFHTATLFLLALMVYEWETKWVGGIYVVLSLPPVSQLMVTAFTCSVLGCDHSVPVEVGELAERSPVS